jgi:hypothetical protein
VVTASETESLARFFITECDGGRRLTRRRHGRAEHGMQLQLFRYRLTLTLTHPQQANPLPTDWLLLFSLSSRSIDCSIDFDRFSRGVADRYHHHLIHYHNTTTKQPFITLLLRRRSRAPRSCFQEKKSKRTQSRQSRRHACIGFRTHKAAGRRLKFGTGLDVARFWWWSLLLWPPPSAAAVGRCCWLLLFGFITCCSRRRDLFLLI